MRVEWLFYLPARLNKTTSQPPPRSGIGIPKAIYPKLLILSGNFLVKLPVLLGKFYIFAYEKTFDLASDFYKNGGKHLFIDEVHKYQDWSKELKMIYDYYPDFQVVFTGSSILDIYKGNADLSHRALSYFLPGLSFREYLIQISPKSDR